MATQNVKVRSGNRVLVKFDGKTVGLVKNLRANDDYSPEPASGIGDIHAQEYVPTFARHNLSASAVVMKTSDLRSAGILIENGDEALEGMVWDLEVYAKDDGTLLRKYTGVSMASCDLEIQAHQICMHNAQMVALDATGTGA